MNQTLNRRITRPALADAACGSSKTIRLDSLSATRQVTSAAVCTRKAMTARAKKGMTARAKSDCSGSR